MSKDEVRDGDEYIDGRNEHLDLSERISLGAAFIIVFAIGLLLVSSCQYPIRTFGTETEFYKHKIYVEDEFDFIGITTQVFLSNASWESCERQFNYSNNLTIIKAYEGKFDKHGRRYGKAKRIY